MDLKIEASNRDVVIGSWDRVVVNIVRGKTTVAAVQRAGEVISECAASRTDLVLMLTLVEGSAPLPPLDVRIELVAFLKGANGKVARSALVFEGEGFRAASVRAVVAGLSLFSRHEYPHRVFASVGAAARFLAGGRGGSPAPHRLMRVVNEARRVPSVQPFVPWAVGPIQPTDSLRPR